MLQAATACTFSTSELPRVLRTWCVLCILTWKCASRHNGEHCLNIASSKNVPNVVYSAHFDLYMRFEPQQHVFFEHPNFQKWSERGLGNVLRQSTPCTFWTSQPSTSKNAPKLGMQFLTSHLTRWLRSRRFSEPTFRPSRATKHWNNTTVLRDFSAFSRARIFFLLILSFLTSSLLTLSLLWLLSPLLFHMFILSEDWLLNSLRQILNTYNQCYLYIYICICVCVCLDIYIYLFIYLYLYVCV